MARYLALDWDQNHLYLVAATLRGSKVKVDRAADWQLDVTAPGDPETLGHLLRERLKQAGIAPAPVLVSLARDRVILKELRFPTVPEAEEADVVRFQAVKELTDAADEVIIDYAPLTDRSAPEQRALALIARKEIIERYQALCEAAGLRLNAVTPRAFGIAAAARQAMSADGGETPAPEPADGAVAVVALAEKWAEFCVLRGDTLVLARTLAVGPALAAEIRRNLTVYDGQAQQRPIQAIYLSTGCDAELRKRLGDLVEVPIYTFDPLAEADVDVPGNPGGFAGAVGLLCALARRGRVPVNFVQPRKAAPPSNRQNVRILVAAVALLVLFIGLFVAGRFLVAATEREAVAAENEEKNMVAQTADALRKGKPIHALGDWESLVWLDELYDLTARVAAVNAQFADPKDRTVVGPDMSPLLISQVTAAPGPSAGKGATRLYAGRLTIAGEFRGQHGRDALDMLVEQFKTEADLKYYMVEGPPVLKEVRSRSNALIATNFTFTVRIKKRPPSEYALTLGVDR